MKMKNLNNITSWQGVSGGVLALPKFSWLTLQLLLRWYIFHQKSLCSDVGLPAIKEAAEPSRICGLLDEKVDLAFHREGALLLNTVQLLVDPKQSPLRHRVVVLLVPRLWFPPQVNHTNPICWLFHITWWGSLICWNDTWQCSLFHSVLADTVLNNIFSR